MARPAKNHPAYIIATLAMFIGVGATAEMPPAPACQTLLSSRLAAVPVLARSFALLWQTDSLNPLIQPQTIAALTDTQIEILPLTRKVLRAFLAPKGTRGISIPASTKGFDLVANPKYEPSPDLPITQSDSTFFPIGYVFIPNRSEIEPSLTFVHEIFHQNFYTYFEQNIERLRTRFPEFIWVDPNGDHLVEEQFFHYFLELHARINDFRMYLALIRINPRFVSLRPEVQPHLSKDLRLQTEALIGLAENEVAALYKITDPRVLALRGQSLADLFPGLPL